MQRSSRTTRRSDCAVKGFCRKLSFLPAAAALSIMPRFSRYSNEYPLMNRTATPGWRFFNWHMPSGPFSPRKTTSATISPIRSEWVLQISFASLSRELSKTEKPAYSNICLNTKRLVASSSSTNTVCVVGDISEPVYACAMPRDLASSDSARQNFGEMRCAANSRTPCKAAFPSTPKATSLLLRHSDACHPREA